jgi:hypothetical protein
MEAILCIKNGRELFERTQALNIVMWLLTQAAISILFVSACVLWHKYFQVITIFPFTLQFTSIFSLPIFFKRFFIFRIQRTFNRESLRQLHKKVNPKKLVEFFKID